MKSNRQSLLDVQRAAKLLADGGLVAFPTETVYGLGADAANEAAVRRTFAVKGRPADHPVIVHLASSDQLDQWARDIPDTAWQLAERFWPGPLTLILKRAPKVLDIVTGGQDTVGLRAPGHPIALSLLHAFGGGIAAPSANRFGRVSPTTAAHVAAELGDAIDGIIDGGACEVGVESTILDLSGMRPQLLRPGAVTADQLAQVLGAIPASPAGAAPRASGTLAHHYAPRTTVYLIPPALLEQTLENHLTKGQRIAVMSGRPPAAAAPNLHWRTMPTDPAEYAHRLYACLRELDTLGCHCILVEEPPAGMGWQAVRDRLQRAAGELAFEGPAL